MGFNAFARLAKLVALLGFLLPWVVVSCSNSVIASATGVQLMTGHLETVAGEASDKPHPDVVVIAIFVVIVAGLALATFLRARAASAALLASSILAIALCFFSIEDLRAGITRQAHAHRYDSQLGDSDSAQLRQSIGDIVQVETRPGYWVTVSALGLAAALALANLAGLRITMGALSTPRPDEKHD